MAERIHITDDDRRARLVARHHLGRTAGDAVEAVRGVTAAHSSDPLTPYLAAWTRVSDLAHRDLDRALYDDRRLLRMHAMRRTLFVVPTDEAAIFAAGAARDVAAKEHRKIVGWLAAEVPGGQVADWIAQVEEQVADVLADGVERRTGELSELVPALATEITVGSGKWTTRTPVSSRLLLLMAMDGRIVRTRPAGSWRSSQYHWTSVRRWLGQPIEELDPGDARPELLRRYLAAHGPATLVDVRWWTGWTAARARQVLADVGAVTVDLDGGGEGCAGPTVWVDGTVVTPRFRTPLERELSA